MQRLRTKSAQVVHVEPGESIILPTDDRQTVLRKLFCSGRFSFREHYESTLYVAYSKKARRRVYVYGHLKYDLWTLIDADPAVEEANERPPKVILGTGIGEGTAIRPDVTTRSKAGVVLHLIQHGHVSPNQLEPLQQWSQSNGCTVRVWGEREIRAEPLRLANLKQLLRFVSVRAPWCEHADIEAVVEVLKSRRTWTILSVVEAMKDRDEQCVLAAIAALVVEQRCFADIDRAPLSFATELSVHHASTAY